MYICLLNMRYQTWATIKRWIFSSTLLFSTITENHKYLFFFGLIYALQFIKKNHERYLFTIIILRSCFWMQAYVFFCSIFGICILFMSSDFQWKQIKQCFQLSCAKRRWVHTELQICSWTPSILPQIGETSWK